ncbi:hypothetical protein B0T10DRAFT_590584 [Thelonectria olida]|uniref:Uncharacterized protein n=1 Tax=Thelonectria olida TaxID=1576542 RepID=A0A9P9AJ02_9HYPO|nr:hypothetical protein B0T10DRAFT_590584 [Thelonectria olida]
MSFMNAQTPKGYDAGTSVYYPAVIMGAGESGIAMACQLKEKLGFDQFRLLERHSGLGGTWWINRYPGVACDVPAVFYSYSFCQNPNWSSFFPSGLEILEYLQSIAERYRIVDKIQFNTEVTVCRWDPLEELWDITVQHLAPGKGDLSAANREKRIREEGIASVYVREEKIKCKVLISAVGGLVEPKAWPEEIPGADNFRGDIFHSARWNHDVSMKDKDVIVVGTGCTAAQIVPELAGKLGAKSVTQLMRSPPWVVRRVEPPFGKEGWKVWGSWLPKNVPLGVAATIEQDIILFGTSNYSNAKRAKYADELLRHIKQITPSKYHDMLTPKYDVGCKRRVRDSGWLSSLHTPKVRLTTLALESVQEDGVRLSPGCHTHPSELIGTEDQSVTISADVIVLANGFETTRWLHPVEIIGSKGQRLESVFEERGGPQMYLGTAMDGFPNFFTLFGPNTVTGHSSVILCSENQVSYALNFIKPILNGTFSYVEVKKEAEVAYNVDIQRALNKTVWNDAQCNSWYKSADGWNSASYPYSQIWFTLRCMFPVWSDWKIKYTRQGIRRWRVRTLLRVLTVMGVFVAMYNLRTWHPREAEIVKKGLRLLNRRS